MTDDPPHDRAVPTRIPRSLALAAGLVLAALAPLDAVEQRKVEPGGADDPEASGSRRS